MNCAECGKLLPADAAFCTACGRRLVPERIEPVLDALRGGQPPRPSHEAELLKPRRTWRDVEPPPSPPPPSFTTHLSQTIAAWPHAPHAAVALGCVLAIAIYFSAAHDQAIATRAGAARIVAATGAMPTTSQPVTPGASAGFSAKQALQGLYGNYDPVLDGAYWTVSDAPKPWTDWNGRTVLIRPLLSRSDEAGTRHVLVTHTVDVKDGMIVKQGAGCSHCKSLIGGALFERRGNEWTLVSDQRFLGVEGAFGSPPQVTVAFPAKTGVQLKIEPSSLASAPSVAATPVVMTAGKKTTGVPARPRPRPAEPPSDSPFPASVAGP